MKCTRFEMTRARCIFIVFWTVYTHTHVWNKIRNLKKDIPRQSDSCYRGVTTVFFRETPLPGENETKIKGLSFQDKCPNRETTLLKIVKKIKNDSRSFRVDPANEYCAVADNQTIKIENASDLSKKHFPPPFSAFYRVYGTLFGIKKRGDSFPHRYIYTITR